MIVTLVLIAAQPLQGCELRDIFHAFGDGRHAERARQEKLRRQKRGRSRAAKQRILADKSHHAAKKETRRRPAAE